MSCQKPDAVTILAVHKCMLNADLKFLHFCLHTAPVTLLSYYTFNQTQLSMHPHLSLLVE